VLTNVQIGGGYHHVHMGGLVMSTRFSISQSSASICKAWWILNSAKSVAYWTCGGRGTKSEVYRCRQSNILEKGADQTLVIVNCGDLDEILFREPSAEGQHCVDSHLSLEHVPAIHSVCIDADVI
jgi:hypothetical protein